MSIETQSMQNKCAMVPLGTNKSCKSKSVKNSIYCKAHNHIMKHNKSKVVQCLQCGKGTTATYQICDKCGGENVRKKHEYIEKIKPWRQEIARLNKIQC